MSYEVFTHDWAVACGEQINENEDYRQAAKNWEWPLVLTMTADPKLGVPERSVYLDLYHGECRKARAATADDLDGVPFVIKADPETWKRVLERDLEPIFGLIRGKLKLAKGSLVSLLPYTTAAKEMVLSAACVETEFPPGV
jgi:putative sterol carrier protein